jgi:hypothetical protein
MKRILFVPLVLGLVVILSSGTPDKNTSQQNNNDKVKVNVGCVAFYNTENFFDTIHQANVLDEEYTPTGPMKWNTQKYKAKLEHISYAISQIGLESSPLGIAMIGLSEIENRGVLDDLVKQPALAKRSLQIAHYEGIDRRGVDVALLYNPKLFTLSNSKSYRLHTADTTFRTRDQLMVSGYLFGEKVHVIVNHWPSRLGGDIARQNRNAAAALTRSIADSLLHVDAKAKIIIMGDLNDDPFDESCVKVLGAKKEINDVKEGEFYNTLWKTLDRGIGSLAYNDQWNLFDQIIISSELAHADRSKLKFWKAEIFNRAFLTQQEGKYKGTPLRTHAAGVWLNGYSDHYPTMIYLIKEVK